MLKLKQIFLRSIFSAMHQTSTDAEEEEEEQASEERDGGLRDLLLLLP